MAKNGNPMHFSTRNQKALKISAALMGTYFIIEFAVGLWIGSVAVLADAFHTLSAMIGILIAIAAGYYASKPPTLKRTFGFIRAEIISAFINGFLLAGMAVYVLWMGYVRLGNPIDLPPIIMLLVAGGGLTTELISMSLLFRGQKRDLNIKGAFWHIINTFVGSLIIIAAALVITFTGFLQIDAILGMSFGLVLFWAAYKIIRDSINILIEKVPVGIDLKRIKKELEAIGGVKKTHHIHAWSLTSGKNIFSAHILVKDIRRANAILKKANEILKEKHGFYFTTLQVESKYIGEAPKELDYI